MLLTPLAELQNRLVRFQAVLQKNEIDAAVLVENVDLFYLAGTIQQGHMLVPASGEPLLLVRKDPERARRESALERVEPLTSLRAVPAALAGLGVSPSGRLGLELDVLPVALFRRYQTLFGEAELVDCGSLLREVRSVKSAFEIGRMCVAAEQADLIMREAARVLREGMTELELSAHVEGAARRAGHQGLIRFRAFNMEMLVAHVFAGPGAGMASYLDGPFGGQGLTPALAQGAGDRPIGRGEPVVIDFGGAADGYVVDQTRILSLGPLPPELAAAYEVCREIQALVAAAALPGVPGGEVYDAALAHARARGLADHFMGARPNQVSFIGHGVGLEIDELPLLARGVETPLVEGQVVACEPKLVYPALGSVGVENTWVVRPGGLERLTLTPDEVWEV